MKKITFLLTIALVHVFCGAQTFNFDGTDEGFTPSGSCTLATMPTYLSVDLTGDGSNPAFGTLTAGVDANANPFVGVTVKNADVAGPTFMRVSYPKASGARRYVNLDITAGDTDYKTYWFDLTNADWAGTEDDVKIHFKAAGNTPYTVPTAGVTVEVDKIQFVDEIPREEKTAYEFNTDGDFEGFTIIVDATANVTAGSLVLVPDGGAIAKITNGDNAVNATANSHVHIVYKNNSPTNNQIRFQFRSEGDNYEGFFGTNVSINQSMGSFETLDIDLSADRPEWTGNAQDFQIALRNTANAGNASDANGNLEIDRIVFDNNATLSSQDLAVNNFSIYPNPATNNINIASNSQIISIKVFDILGKQVLLEGQTSRLNISNLKTGVYLMNVTLFDGSKILKRFIKN
jgi:hypothetical protein